MPLPNFMRGEVMAELGGQRLRLCVTLRALAEMENHFHVSGFKDLGERLKGLCAKDLMVVLQALVIDEADIRALNIAFPEAIRAVVAAFAAMNGPDDV